MDESDRRLERDPASGAPRYLLDDRYLAANQDHLRWVSERAREMSTVKVGMTRYELLDVFEPNGGLSTAAQGVFRHRKCPYFKIVVEFEPQAEHRDEPGGRFFRYDDVITRISGPYVSVHYSGGA